MKKSILPSVFALFIIIIDQYTKQLVIKTISMGKSLTYKNILLLEPQIINDALYKNNNFNLLVTIFLPILIIIMIIIILFKSKVLNFIQRFGLCFIMGGSCSYLIDRFIRSLNLLKFIKIIPINFIPIFNIADLAVVIGGIVMLLSLLSKERV